MDCINKISVIGLGYVGLPLAVELAKKYKVTGFDLNKKRVTELKKAVDRTNEISNKKLLRQKNDISNSEIFIISVPTPINIEEKPDLKLLKNACKHVGEHLKNNSIVVFESTVYPGTTEDECVPILEKYSKLKLNKEFSCAYSPERINPGDKKRRLTNIPKIVSGSNKNALNIVTKLYKSIIKAKVHKVSSIKVAEAAKIIENTQRDINIALMNELSIIFSKMNIDTNEVIDAASTKWNFSKFTPGLVGGHCIGVDPYYLTYKAEKLGYKPKIISAGRKLNDSMAKYVSQKMLESLNKKSCKKKYKILILGYTFKENCNDYRNTKVGDIYKFLVNHNHNVEVYDPLINYLRNKELNKINFISNIRNGYDGVIIAVAHKIFLKIGLNQIRKSCKQKHVIFDLKNLFKSKEIDLKL